MGKSVGYKRRLRHAQKLKKKQRWREEKPRSSLNECSESEGLLPGSIMNIDLPQTLIEHELPRENNVEQPSVHGPSQWTWSRGPELSLGGNAKLPQESDAELPQGSDAKLPQESDAKLPQGSDAEPQGSNAESPQASTIKSKVHQGTNDELPQSQRNELLQRSHTEPPLKINAELPQ
jgi:hypothetical protein